MEVYPDNWLMKFHMKMSNNEDWVKVPEKKELYKAQQYLEGESSEGLEK